MRTEEQLGEQWEQRQLSLLGPLLAIKVDMWRELETKPDCASLLVWVLVWVLAAVPEANRKYQVSSLHSLKSKASETRAAQDARNVLEKLKADQRHFHETLPGCRCC